MNGLVRFTISVIVFCFVCFLGYMCGVPIIERSADNVIPYTFAFILAVFSNVIMSVASIKD